MRALSLFSVLALLGLASSTFAADLVDNPAYQNWAKYKPETTVSYKQAMEMPGMPQMAAMMPQTAITYKLLEVKPESVTVEVATSTMANGQTRENKVTQVISAKVEKGKEYVTNPSEVNVEIKDAKEGKDTVDVKGAKVDAVTHEYTVVMTSAASRPAATAPQEALPAQQAAHIKVWHAEAVPGGLVKMEQNTNMGPMGEVKMTMSLVDFKVVK